MPSIEMPRSIEIWDPVLRELTVLITVVRATPFMTEFVR